MLNALAVKVDAAQHAAHTTLGNQVSGARGDVILAEDPGIKSNPSYWPFMDDLKDMVGGALSVVFVVAVAAILGAAAILMIGKLSSSSELSRRSTTILVAILIFATIAGSASAAVGFFTDIKLF
ncbi:hypothetical protein Bra3105_18285 [Brachybacterium halotolerans subsp. kimchii]|uniref:hypothetical protein n=1 Tax=Brachybacterium halotolerans TaxID=2795215 RepID=UPI001E500873|nr:hypothetical protein [Brachybacterium halotolerans]UEJ82747.1 hypothetical protein Bra3105_18285 [Brachybacterium halotolerans subsp. kimchii]